jgi:hypothetical protein
MIDPRAGRARAHFSSGSSLGDALTLEGLNEGTFYALVDTRSLKNPPNFKIDSNGQSSLPKWWHIGASGLGHSTKSCAELVTGYVC